LGKPEGIGITAGEHMLGRLDWAVESAERAEVR